MVTKREFNRIKKENPESRIWKRTWEEQKVRNELAKTLIKAWKKWVNHPYVEKLNDFRKIKKERNNINELWHDALRDEKQAIDMAEKWWNRYNETAFELSWKSKQVEKLKNNLNGWVDTNLWELTFSEYPWWNEKDGKEQVRIFTELLKSQKLVSVNDEWILYNISINIPWYVTENIYCSKELLDSERGSRQGGSYLSKHTSQTLRQIKWQLPEWSRKLSIRDIVSFSRKLLPLYDKLWMNKIDRNFWNDDYPKSWDESVFAFFYRLISNLIPRQEGSRWYFWVDNISSEDVPWDHYQTDCYLSPDTWKNRANWLCTSANWEDWQFLFIG